MDYGNGNEEDDDLFVFLVCLIEEEQKRLRSSILAANVKMRVTAWQKLLSTRSNRMFFQYLRVSVQAFDALVKGFTRIWMDQTLLGKTRHRHRSRGKFCAADVCGLSLFYLNSMCTQNLLCLIFGACPSTISEHLSQGLRCLVGFLENVDKSRVKWPTGQALEDLEAIGERKYPSLKGLKLIGFVDGCKIRTQTSANIWKANANYNGWLHGHYRCNLLVFSFDGKIIHAGLDYLGSTHDSAIGITSNFYDEAEKIFASGGYQILGDSAFADVDGVISLTDSYLAQSDVGADLVSMRQGVEWGMRIWQLHKRLQTKLTTKDDRRRLILWGTVLLINWELSFGVPGNQIASVYGNYETPDSLFDISLN